MLGSMTTIGYWLFFLSGQKATRVLGSTTSWNRMQVPLLGSRICFWTTRLLTIHVFQYFIKPCQVVFNILVDYFPLYYWSTRVYMPLDRNLLRCSPWPTSFVTLWWIRGILTFGFEATTVQFGMQFQHALNTDPSKSGCGMLHSCLLPGIKDRCS